MRVRFTDEWEGGFRWTPAEPEFLQRSSHAIRAGGGVWLTDPLDGEGVDERVRALGEPAGVVQLIDRHNRACAAVAARLGIPHHRVPLEGVDGAPFETIGVVDAPGWREVALWFPAEQVLVAGDALGTVPYFRAPSDRLAVHPLLRPFPPRQLGRLDPEHLLVGHGDGVHGPAATRALRDALTTARRRLPAAYAQAVTFFLRGRRSA